MDGSTPRPWRLTVVGPTFSLEIHGPSDGFCADVVGIIHSKRDARRIVAAVNATSDLPIEALEADVVRKLVEAGQALLDNLADGEFVSLTRLDAFRAALTLAKGEAA